MPSPPTYLNTHPPTFTPEQPQEACVAHNFIYTFKRALLRIATSNKLSNFANMYYDIDVLLIRGGVEPNPGPLHHKLRICHVNINSITTPGRLDELHFFLDEYKVDILALSETKLDETIHDSLFNLPNFHPPFTKHRSRHGGGVAIYTRNDISAHRLTELECPSEEWISTKTKINGETILTCALYLPPNLTHDRLENFIDNLIESITLAQRFSDATIVVLGDFNTGNIYLPSNVPHSGVTSFDTRLKDSLETLNLTQLISTPTRQTDTSSNLRDLVITNNPQMIIESGVLPPFSNIDHFPVFINLNIEKQPSLSFPERHIWDYEHTDIDKLTHTLMHTDWDFINDNNVHDATEQFTQTILTAAAEAIPLKTIKARQNNKNWMTTELRASIRKRDRLFRLARHRQTTHDWLKWRQQRNMTTALNRRLKKENLQKHINKLSEYKQNPYKYHKILKTLTGRTKCDVIPPLENNDHDIVTDNTQKANLINDYFVSQTKIDTDGLTLPATHDGENNYDGGAVPALKQIQVTESEVLKILNSLDVNKSTGPDKLPTKIIKMIAILIVAPLTKLFNKSLSSGIFPDKWKEAQVTPIFKKNGSPSDLKQYRPISLLPCLSKILEKNSIFLNLCAPYTLQSSLRQTKRLSSPS